TGALAFVMVFGFPGGDRGIVHGEPDVIVYAVNVGARWSSSEDSRVYKIDPSICRSARILESDLFFDLGIVFPDEFGHRFQFGPCLSGIRRRRHAVIAARGNHPCLPLASFWLNLNGTIPVRALFSFAVGFSSNRRNRGDERQYDYQTWRNGQF